MAGELMRCSGHLRCIGPTAIPNHKTECPYGGHDDCDNEGCWTPCVFCVPESAEDYDVQNIPTDPHAHAGRTIP